MDVLLPLILVALCLGACRLGLPEGVNQALPPNCR